MESVALLLGFVVPYRMKYTQKLFSNLSQIGQILGIKYQQNFIFKFQLYKLSWEISNNIRSGI